MFCFQKDSIVVCLIFPDMKPVPRKVVFNPRVDNFEMLQISGLYDLLANLTTTDLRMFAMSNGVISRPILIKRQDKVAQLVNLRIEMNNGAIQKLEWINVCDDLACENNICIDTQELWRNTTYYDSNCFLYGCSSSVNSQCDTKVYLTFIGEDREGRVFTSDNYRLSNFMDYSLNTLFSSAKSVGGGIYSKLSNMYLRYYLNEKKERVYTFSFYDPSNNPTISAHPARFSPDDPFSEQRMKCKERFNLLPTQKAPIQL
eukprot:403363952